MISKIKKVFVFLLSFLICISSVMPVYAATNEAVEITSVYLFEQSTLDDLELNLAKLPEVEVIGTNAYTITTEEYAYGADETMPDKQIANLRLTFNKSVWDYNTALDGITIKVTYEKAGTLNGKPVEMVLTYSDIHRAQKENSSYYDNMLFYWTAPGTPEDQISLNEFWAVGFDRFNLNIQFTYTDTNEIVHLGNCYFTLYSMDGRSNHSEAAATSEAAEVYWYKERQIKYISTDTSTGKPIRDIYYGSGDKEEGNSRDTRNAVCWQYKNTDNINIDMMCLYGSYGFGYHLNFTPLTAVVPEAPVKTVDKSTATTGDRLVYTITQSLPKSYDDSFSLESMIIMDTLDSNVEYISASLYDATGKDITFTAGNLTTSTSLGKQLIKYTFNSSYLQDISYDRQNIKLNIIADVRKEISDTSVINNQAEIQLNDSYKLTTNEVPTKIYYPVTTNYIDTQGTKLAESQIANYFVGEQYTTEPKDFYGYELTATPKNAVGTIKDSGVIVNYIYALSKASVVVNYLDENGLPLLESEIINGQVFDNYITTAKEIEGYELTAVPENETGTMTEDQIIVNYIYRLKSARITVKWVDDNGNELIPSETLLSKYFEPYETDAKDFYGYTLTATPTNASGIVNSDNIVVTYVYTQKQSSIVMNYLNENMESISPSETLTGNVGDRYTTTQKNIYGYDFKEVQGNTTGQYTEEIIVVNYIYTLKSTSILVNYLDENNKPLTDSKTITGHVFDTYNTESKLFYGYELISIPENATGTMTEDQIVVNYFYRLKSATVNVNYVDEEGYKLTDPIVLNGYVFDKYQTETKEFSEYNLVKIPDNASGIMTEDQIIVNYVYTLKPATVTVQYVTNFGVQLIDDITINGKARDSYTTDQKDFYGYELTATPNNVSGNMTVDPITVIYVYQLKESSVVVNYIDENGAQLADSETLIGHVFDQYQTSSKEIDGYQLTVIPENAEGTITEEQIVVNYIYTEMNISETTSNQVVSFSENNSPDIPDTGGYTGEKELILLSAINSLILLGLIFLIKTKSKYII